MTKAQLLAELGEIFLTIGSPVPKAPIGTIKPYAITVFASGLSEKNKKPVASPRELVFYVKDEGLGSEAAYYAGTEPVNTVNTDVTVSSTSFSAISKLYNSVELQDRVRASLFVMSASVFQENDVTSATSLTIGTGLQSLTIGPDRLVGVIQMSVGLAIVLANGSNTMTGQVASYDATTGALVVSVGTVEGSGTFDNWTVSIPMHTKRMKLIRDGSYDIQSVVMRFMGAVAINPMVQTAGTAVEDAVLLGIVSSLWDYFSFIIEA